jgi:hypothetical protein
MSNEQSQLRRSVRQEETKRARTEASAKPGTSSSQHNPGGDDISGLLAAFQDELTKLKRRGADNGERIDEILSWAAEEGKKRASLEEGLAELLAKMERIMSSRDAGPHQPEDASADNLSGHERRLRNGLAKCLVLKHLEEKVGESSDQLRAAVFELGPFYWMEKKVIRMERLGFRPAFDSEAKGEFWERPRAVMVEFVDVESKMVVKRKGLHFSENDSTRHLSFDHAITAEQQRLRAAQWPLIQEAKAKRVRWFWSDVAPHKLIVSGAGVRSADWVMRETILP